MTTFLVTQRHRSGLPASGNSALPIPCWRSLHLACARRMQITAAPEPRRELGRHGGDAAGTAPAPAPAESPGAC